MPQVDKKDVKKTQTEDSISLESYLGLVPGLSEGERLHFTRKFRNEKTNTATQWRKLTNLKDLKK